MKVIHAAHQPRRRRLYGSLLVLILFIAPLPVLADTAATDTQPIAGDNVVQPAPAPSPVPTPSPAPPAADNPAPSPVPPADPGLHLDTPVVDSTSSATVQTSINNQVNSDATSGDAKVNDNYIAGDATSGKADAKATVLNVANSTTNFGTGSNFTAFTQDVYGDWQQNIVIDPTNLAAAANNSAGDDSSSTSGTSIQKTVTLTDILNNIVLSAHSGDAAVTDNYQAGNATSGDANALANIINIVGSSIGAPHSFLGVVNIYGNLKGDILVPSSFVNGLFGGNQPAGSQGTAGDSYDFTNTSSNTTSIDNNVNASANSGNAAVSDNHTGGNATSGNATTNITVYNLTGQTVVAKNSLLVFVNVLGKWVGMIVQAPGSTAATLTGGGNGGSQATGNGSSESTTKTHITNNIAVDAGSGGATVADNDQGGNATSGNAHAGVNLLNITDSNFSLGDWFGTLFINVLGSWVGNFGIQQAAGNGSQGSTPDQPIQDVKVYQFEGAAQVVSPSSNRGQTAGHGGHQYGYALGSQTEEPTPPSIDNPVVTVHTSKQVQAEGKSARTIGIDVIALMAIVSALTLLLALVSMSARRLLGRLRVVLFRTKVAE